MDFLNGLPSRTEVGRVVPKNAFDEYTNTKQKKLFTDCIQRMTWTHKLSRETINLESKEIKEIQVFKVELKEASTIPKILEIINKSISYHIVFWIEFKDQAYISTAAKHPHPTNEDLSVIDWTFTSDWFDIATATFRFNLKGSLDSVFKDLCIQLTGKPELSEKSMNAILENQQEIDRLKKEIAKLKSAISRSKQFNEKVELNIRLKAIEQTLSKLSELH
jgi:hypothetical protein